MSQDDEFYMQVYILIKTKFRLNFSHLDSIILKIVIRCINLYDYLSTLAFNSSILISCPDSVVTVQWYSFTGLYRCYRSGVQTPLYENRSTLGKYKTREEKKKGLREV